MYRSWRSLPRVALMQRHDSARPEHRPVPELRADRSFRERVRRVHRLGPRATGELIAEVLAAHPPARGFVLERLDYYATLDRDLVAVLGGADWIEPAAVVRLVAGARP